jgi:hypothetical protein
MAFGMPETNLSSRGSAEIMGNLTFWHLVCQKYLNCSFENGLPTEAVRRDQAEANQGTAQNG